MDALARVILAVDVSAISPATHELIDDVVRVAGERVWPWRRAALLSDMEEKLREVGASGQWLAMPRLVPLACCGRRELADIAALSIGDLLRSVRMADLGVVDRALRQLAECSEHYGAWAALKPAALDALSGVVEASAVLQVAMCHRSGYVRERAVRLAAAESDGVDVPMLLLRANDWVEPVRVAATEVLRAQLRPDRASHFVAALPLLERMRGWERIDDVSIVDEIDAFVASEAAAKALREGLAARGRDERFACCRRVAELGGRDAYDVLRGAAGDRDPAISHWAARTLCEADEPVFLSSAELLLGHRTGSVRHAAAWRLVSLGQPLPWNHLLFDRHAGVRAIAQQLAAKAGVDPADEYRRALAAGSGAERAATISGLGETGGADDVALVGGVANDASPRVRVAVLRTLARLAADDVSARCVAALGDPSPSVCHAGRELLLMRPGAVAPSVLWRALASAPTPAGKRDALTVLAAGDYWETAPYILRAAAGEDALVRARAEHHLEQWIARRTRVFTSPRAETALAIRDALGLPGLAEGVRRRVTIGVGIGIGG